jgi:hypothetical protein
MKKGHSVAQLEQLAWLLNIINPKMMPSEYIKLYIATWVPNGPPNVAISSGYSPSTLKKDFLQRIAACLSLPFQPNFPLYLNRHFHTVGQISHGDGGKVGSDTVEAMIACAQSIIQERLNQPRKITAIVKRKIVKMIDERVEQNVIRSDQRIERRIDRIETWMIIVSLIIMACLTWQFGALAHAVIVQYGTIAHTVSVKYGNIAHTVSVKYGNIAHAVFVKYGSIALADIVKYGNIAQAGIVKYGNITQAGIVKYGNIAQTETLAFITEYGILATTLTASTVIFTKK